MGGDGEPCAGLPTARLRLCLQAVPPGSGGRAPEPPLARAQAGPADGAEAAGLSRGLETGVRTPGGAEDCPQFSQGEGVWAAELGLRPASLTLRVPWGLFGLGRSGAVLTRTLWCQNLLPCP